VSLCLLRRHCTRVGVLLHFAEDAVATAHAARISPPAHSLLAKTVPVQRITLPGHHPRPLGKGDDAFMHVLQLGIAALIDSSAPVGKRLVRRKAGAHGSRQLRARGQTFAGAEQWTSLRFTRRHGSDTCANGSMRWARPRFRPRRRLRNVVRRCICTMPAGCQGMPSRFGTLMHARVMSRIAVLREPPPYIICRMVTIACWPIAWAR
jgi:hypothetical protein